MMIIGGLIGNFDYLDLTGITHIKSVRDISRAIDVFPWLATAVNATISYLVAFKVLNYCRDNAMETLEWRENSNSYVRAIFIASSLSSVISTIVIVLVFTLFGKLEYVIRTPADVIHLLVFQFVVSLIVSIFGIQYRK